MSWVTESWRLKLLAIGLSVLMLGAVAFAQNPPTIKTFTVTSIQYTIPPNLVVLNAPTRTTVRMNGLADTLQTMSASSILAIFDLTKVAPGPAVRVNMSVSTQIQGVHPENPSVPFVLTIDRRVKVPLTVQVRFQNPATEGWVVTKSEAKCPNSPCVVNFDGPAQWETNLKAYADVTAPVQADSIDIPNLAVDLEQNGRPMDTSTFSKTVQPSGLDQAGVAVHIEAKTGTTSKQVVLIDAPPTHAAPSGYRVTAITIDPISVLITGKADVLSKIRSLTLPAVDLTGHTSEITFRVTIAYPSTVTGSIATARVTYSISPNPNAQASPTPTP
jgi:YbbR domain-containing protein